MRYAAAVFVLGALASPAFAAPPAGSPCIAHPDLPECVWWRNQVNIHSGMSCCGAPGQDGHVLHEWALGKPPKENDWRIVAVNDPDNNSGYQVYIGDRWWDVPPTVVTKITGVEPDISRRYQAKGWWYVSRNTNNQVVEIGWYCFEPGVAY